jgi:hypothetical protein
MLDRLAFLALLAYAEPAIRLDNPDYIDKASIDAQLRSFFN